MKKECDECGIEKTLRQFDVGSDTCKACMRRFHQEAEQFAKKATVRDANARTQEHKDWAADTEGNRDATRQKAPPREYPWPWRRSKT